MKRILTLILAIFLLLAMAGCGDSDQPRYEGEGYDTPEKTMRAYVEALQSGDANRVLRVCAIESYVENFDFAAYIDWMKTYTTKMPLPGDDSMSYTINLSLRLSTVTNGLGKQLKFFMDIPGLIDGEVIGPIREGEEYGSGEEFARAMDLEGVQKKLKDIKLIDVQSVLDYFDYDPERVSKNFEKYAASIGADEMTEYIATLQIDGEDYVLALTLVRYGNRWFVLNLTGSLAGVSAATGGFALKSDLE